MAVHAKKRLEGKGVTLDMETGSGAAEPAMEMSREPVLACPTLVCISCKDSCLSLSILPVVPKQVLQL